MRRGRQNLRWSNGTTNSMDVSLSKLQEMVKDREAGVLQSMGSQRERHNLATKQHHLFILLQLLKDAFCSQLVVGENKFAE